MARGVGIPAIDTVVTHCVEEGTVHCLLAVIPQTKRCAADLLALRKALFHRLLARRPLVDALTAVAIHSGLLIARS
jgi:hypothetical protein